MSTRPERRSRTPPELEKRGGTPPIVKPKGKLAISRTRPLMKYLIGAIVVAAVAYFALRPSTPVNEVAVTAIPTVSIIMIAHNENMYLERTFNSIMNNTPLDHLLEIIFVDDASNPPASTILDPMNNSRIKIIRSDERTGLIRAKTMGARAAKGDVLVFLDAHVRTYPGWLEPMMDLTSENYRRVVVPAIPVMDGNTWEQIEDYEGYKLIFDWKMDFIWFVDEEPSHSRYDYVPMMSGGLLAITRKWFFETGAYDEGMLQWGGENVEQSVKIWLCGGEIVVARNSRVGHVFRDESPYDLNTTQIHVNKARAIDVWFDEWANYYYRANPFDRERRSSEESLASRMKIKQDLNCKPFSTYVEKFRDVFIEHKLLSTEAFGIRNIKTGKCIKLSDDGSLKGVACDAEDRGQVFIPDSWDRLRSGEFVDDCLSHDDPLGVDLCSAHEDAQKGWLLDESSRRLQRVVDAEEPTEKTFCVHMKPSGDLTINTTCQDGEWEKYNPHAYSHELYH